MTEWTSNSTLDNTVSNASKDLPREEFSINEAIIHDLKDTYVGTQGMKFELKDKDKIDLPHRQYFAVCLKENSLSNALAGQEPLTESYTQFYSELLFERDKTNGLSSLVNKFKTIKLPEADTQFFNNLSVIKSYIQGEPAENIAQKIDAVIEHRDSYLKILPVQDRQDKALSTQEAKSEIVVKRYNNALKELFNFTREHTGTTYMCSAIDSFIETSSDTFKDFNADIPDVYKKVMFNFFHNEYSKIIHNGNVEDSTKAMKDFNTLHKRIFGADMNMVALEFGSDGCSYNITNTPYE